MAKKTDRYVIESKDGERVMFLSSVRLSRATAAWRKIRQQPEWHGSTLRLERDGDLYKRVNSSTVGGQ